MGDLIIQRLDKYSTPITETGCLIWLGCVTNGGYGKVSIGNKQTMLAHRAAWEISNGNIPHGLFVCHKCDIPSCVNINHLFLGAPKENTNDCINKERFCCGEKHHKAKLTKEDVIYIRNSNKKRKDLAIEFGLNVRSIYHIRANGGWANAR